MHPLFKLVDGLDLPNGDFAIFGSGPLIVRGIIPAANDLDIICRGAAWDKARSIGTLHYRDDYDLHIASVFDGRVTLGTQWGIGHFDIDALIDTAEEIDGLPFVQLQNVVRYKLVRASDKDLRHLRALHASGYQFNYSVEALNESC